MDEWGWVSGFCVFVAIFMRRLFDFIFSTNECLSVAVVRLYDCASLKVYVHIYPQMIEASTLTSVAARADELRYLYRAIAKGLDNSRLFTSGNVLLWQLERVDESARASDNGPDMDMGE
jgi:hypothetical protein